jgi:hypothetical protein
MVWLYLSAVAQVDTQRNNLQANIWNMNSLTNSSLGKGVCASTYSSCKYMPGISQQEVMKPKKSSHSLSHWLKLPNVTRARRKIKYMFISLIIVVIGGLPRLKPKFTFKISIVS